VRDERGLRASEGALQPPDYVIHHALALLYEKERVIGAGIKHDV
jgi:hypothetical protein